MTPQPTTPAIPAAKVFFFGGSTMWGVGQRDDHTIPAEAARRLQTLAGPGARIEVTNYGETGYIETQGMLELMLALRAGARPDVVVFYDGINDVGTAVQFGRAGIPQNENKRAAEFAMGRALDRSHEVALRDDLRALGILSGQAFRRLAFVNAILSTKKAPEPTFIAADSAARDLARVYVENARVIEGMSKEYGFIPIYIWQPTIQSSQKKLTPFEEGILATNNRDPFTKRLTEVHRAVPPLLEAPMQAVAPGRFINAHTLFRDDTMAVYIDRIGHTTETAVPRILDSFWPQLQAAVESRLARGRAARP
jgi:hypothetical protein